MYNETIEIITPAIAIIKDTVVLLAFFDSFKVFSSVSFSLSDTVFVFSFSTLNLSFVR